MTRLEPGWLGRQIEDVAALRRAQQKIVTAARSARINGFTRPVQIEFTVSELRALDYDIQPLASRTSAVR